MLALLAGLLCAAACKKGDPGPPGPPGPAGPAGTPGKTNVFYSNWFRPPAYVKDTVFGIFGFKHNEPAPLITQGIIDSGVVLVYGKLLGYVATVWPVNQVQLMPIDLTYIQSGKTQTDTWNARPSAGNLQIRFVNNTNEYNAISTAHQFRYVIIPGGQRINLPLLTYQEVCEQYGIPEY